MVRKGVSLLLFSILFLFALATLQLDAKASPTIIKVPQDYTTIQEAINQANPGDTIQVSSGTYQETLFINKTLTLIGEDKNNTILEGYGCDCTVIQANLTTVNISGFTIHNASNGIVLEECNNSVIKENNVNCTNAGIWLLHSDNNTVSDNNVKDAWWFGIVLCGHSSNNTVKRNTIRDNTQGFGVTGEDNLIIHNNFINNQNQTKIIESFHNAWNNTYEGNYWSNYNGTDANQDGIGDTPYLIDENNQDNHPLMGVFSDFNATSEHHVQTICNSTISSFQFNGTAISFSVSGDDGTVGFCRICVPTSLMDGTYTVLVNGTEVPHTLLPCSNGTHSYLYFTYQHSTHEVVIQGFPPDTTPPTVSILFPKNKTYATSDVPLTFTVSESSSWIGYSLDGEQNQTISGNRTLSDLSDGAHNMVIYATDTAGNTGISEIVHFTIETPEPEPFPTWIVAVIVIIAVFGLSLLVYFTKVRKTAEET